MTGSGSAVVSLTVGGFGAVFALVVMLGDIGWQACGGSVEKDGAIGEASDELQQVSIFDGGRDGLPPGEGGVSGDEDAGDCEGVEAAIVEEASDDGAGVEDVGLFDFVGSEGFGDGDLTVEVVGVGGAKAGDGAAGLCPTGGELGMGVDDAADLGEFAIEEQMGVEVAGRVEGAFDDGAVEGCDDEVFGGHGGVWDAAGFYGDEGLGAGAVNAAGVAEGVKGEATLGDFLVGEEDLVTEIGEEHRKPFPGEGPLVGNLKFRAILAVLG